MDQRNTCQLASQIGSERRDETFSLAKARFLTAVTYPLSNRGEKTGGNCNFQREIGKAQRATERPDPFGKTGPENGHK
jgi:hypothetical protein